MALRREAGLDCLRVQRSLERLDGAHWVGRVERHCRFERVPGRTPGGQPAVQHLHPGLSPARSSHHSRDGASHHCRCRTRPRACRASSPIRPASTRSRRRWAADGGHCRGSGEPTSLLIQVRVHGARDVAGQVVECARGWYRQSSKRQSTTSRPGAGNPGGECGGADQWRGRRSGLQRHARIIAAVTAAYNSSLQFHMAIDVYWSSGSPFCWRVLLALELKGLSYRSHLLHVDFQEHKAPQMLAMNPRGRLPVLRDNDYVVFESVAVLYYLDRKYPDPPIFGRSPEEGGVILRVIDEFQTYTEAELMRIIYSLRNGKGARMGDRITQAMHTVARRGPHHRGTTFKRRLDRRRLRSLPRTSPSIPAFASCSTCCSSRRRRSCPRVFFPPRSSILRWPDGCGASRRCRDSRRRWPPDWPPLQS